jgi:hypothetical protein
VSYGALKAVMRWKRHTGPWAIAVRYFAMVRQLGAAKEIQVAI